MYAQFAFLLLEASLLVVTEIYLSVTNTFPWKLFSVIWGSLTFATAVASGLAYNLWLRSNRQGARSITISHDTYITGKPMMFRVQMGTVLSLIVFVYQIGVFMKVVTLDAINYSEANHHVVRVPHLINLNNSSLWAMLFLAMSLNSLFNGMATVQEIWTSKPKQ